MRNVYAISLVLVIVGALNWGLVGIFEWNLVSAIFTDSGTQTVANTAERVIYILVGVGGIIALPMLAATLSRGRRDYGDTAYRTDEEVSSERRRAA